MEKGNVHLLENQTLEHIQTSRLLYDYRAEER